MEGDRPGLSRLGYVAGPGVGRVLRVAGRTWRFVRCLVDAAPVVHGDSGGGGGGQWWVGGRSWLVAAEGVGRDGEDRPRQVYRGVVRVHLLDRERPQWVMEG